MHRNTPDTASAPRMQVRKPEIQLVPELSVNLVALSTRSTKATLREFAAGSRKETWECCGRGGFQRVFHKANGLVNPGKDQAAIPPHS